MILLLAFLQAMGQSDSNRIVYYKKIIRYLASDSLQGRAVATRFEDSAAAFLIREVSNTKHAKAKLQYFKFRHPIFGDSIASKNVYAFVNNKAKQTILIGAHYDHIGLGEIKSNSFSKKGQVHNGADDNASGVALALGLLQNLNEWQDKRFNYLFVFYSAHEIGLYGSKNFDAFYRNKQFKKLSMVLNFDMVGRLDTKSPILSIYTNAKANLDGGFNEKSGKVKINQDNPEKLKDTDAGNFAHRAITCISLSSGIHDDYHKVSDDEGYINYNGIAAIQEFIEKVLKQGSIYQ